MIVNKEMPIITTITKITTMNPMYSVQEPH